MGCNGRALDAPHPTPTFRRTAAGRRADISAAACHRLFPRARRDRARRDRERLVRAPTGAHASPAVAAHASFIPTP
ncbi:hypothetical protein F5D26_09680 [Burkholderia pseudomallei]|nr:hypothetical protein T210_0123460 [Burkholderia pseudomallei MSHR6137]KAA8768916.1 hypothetical protein F5D26_09680 [Burkholderia pseudomallei]